jgi:uncharacterized membrane protein YccC
MLPDRRAWFFSVKTFAAAMLALYVSFRLALPAPYWAMATCYIVAQPWSGMARAKGLYRLLGTAAGAAAAVAMVPNLVNAPPLLVAAMAAWVAGCLAASLLIRAPQSYAFMLAGYTAAIIGFPAVDQPQAIFDIAVARVTEIGTGIVSMLLVDSLFPVASSRHVLAQLDKLLADLARLAHDAVSGGAAAALHAEQLQVARDNVALATLVAHLRYEPPSGNGVRDWAPVMHMRLRNVPLLLSSISDRSAALRAYDPAALQALAPLLQRLGEWLLHAEADPTAGLAEAGLMQNLIDAVACHEKRAFGLRGHDGNGHDALDEWRDLMRRGLLDRLSALVSAWRDSLAARLAIGTAARPAGADYAVASGWAVAHADTALVLQSSLSVFLALMALCAFWIATGWPDGANAASLAAMASALFVHQDNAGRALRQFLVGSMAAVFVVGLYQFALLPPITTGFVPLVLALGLMFLPLGAALGTAALTPWALPVTLMSAISLGVTAHFAPDFASFANGAVAMVTGVGVAMVTVSLVRPAGVAWRVQRLAQADQLDVARAARGAALPDLVGGMMERFDAVAARLPAGAPPPRAGMHTGSMVGLRLALNVAELRALLPVMAPALAARVDRVLRRVARHLETAPSVNHAGASLGAAGPGLRLLLDQALREAATQQHEPAALALAGLRRALLPGEPPPSFHVPVLALAA